MDIWNMSWGLSTNKLLLRMGKAESNVYCFPRNEVETFDHLFGSVVIPSKFTLDVGLKFFNGQLVFSKADIFFLYRY